MTWGILTDYHTGSRIREASAEEWRYTALTVNGDAAGGESGAFADDDGRMVWVDGGPVAEVTDDDIAELEQEAGQHGDTRQAELCRLALGEDSAVRDSARAECVRIIIDNRMNTNA